MSDTDRIPEYEARLYVYRARILDDDPESAYDGDTMWVRVRLGGGVDSVWQLRLRDVDTPELRGADREFGLYVRDRVRELIVGRTLYIETFRGTKEIDKGGKYGRYLARIWFSLDGQIVELNQWLRDNALLKGDPWPRSEVG